MGSGDWDRLFGGGEPLPPRIVLPGALAESIRAAARSAYPDEGCGLLVGQGERVTRVVPSRNVALRGRDRFEVDPRVRLDLMKALRGTPERLLGHWHSHPDAPAVPSATDLAQAYEPALLWLICGVSGTGEAALSAWKMVPEAGAFTPVPLVVEDVTRG
ncbi:Mov34/MPN/PAD-1 family protein [Caenispirillum salinarum]|nr:M67 family metallopeptidase [Caenispirillum salinarum]